MWGVLRRSRSRILRISRIIALVEFSHAAENPCNSSMMKILGTNQTCWTSTVSPIFVSENY
jgi:hypothetical protein